MLMPLVLGVLAGLATALLGGATGLDRDRAYYPTLLMVIAAYYILFAAMAGSPSVLARESIAMAAFFAVAIAGFRRSLPLVAGGLLAHGGGHCAGRLSRLAAPPRGAGARDQRSFDRSLIRSVRRSSWAFTATITVLRDISTAPTAGESTMPCPASTPAASGIATML